MATALICLYSLFASVALLNLLLMRRPGRRADGPKICVLIPARNEEGNLRELLSGEWHTERRSAFGIRRSGEREAEALDAPAPGATTPSDLNTEHSTLNTSGTVSSTVTPSSPKVYVYDDESTDRTAEVAASLGAIVIRPRGPLPEGWTGKNRACHELAQAAAEDSDAEWYLFLDADVRPHPDFMDAMRDLAATSGLRNPVITGIPQLLPGTGIEPLFLAWVGWIILATNPFGLVSRTGKGHNRFKNGQVHMWRATTYTDLWPHEKVKGKIMEDVMIGRLLAKEGIRVETANLSRVLSVRMYENWRQTLDGMSKNAYEITDSVVGSLLLALLMLTLGWAWLAAGSLWWACLVVLALSGLFVGVQARSTVWPALLMPVVLTIASWTMVRSTIWHRTGRVRWKGRLYGKSGSPDEE